MNSKALLAIAIKVFGLWFLAQLFVHVASFSPMFFGIGQWSNTAVPIWAILLVSISFLISGFIISFVIIRLGNSALSSMSVIEPSETLDQKFVLQVFGIFFVINSLVHIPSVSRIIFSAKETELYYYLPLSGYLIQLVIGVLFIVHSSWWSHVLLKLRGRA